MRGDSATGRRGDREYFNALHDQISDAGAAAMFHALRNLPLEDWHPREMPEAIQYSEALRKQQAKTLPPMERWYLGLLMNGALPGASVAKPHVARSTILVEHGQSNAPRLRQDLDPWTLKEFLTDSPSRIGVVCEKLHTSTGEAYKFPPLDECRAAWVRIYGPQSWTPVTEWYRPKIIDLIAGD